MASKKTPHSSDTIRQYLNIAFSITQVVCGFFTNLTGIGTSIQSQSAGTETPVTPATYAFSIWGVIFLFSFVYAVYQALPSQKTNPLFRKIGFLTAFAFFGNSLWELVAQLITFNWPTVIVITAVLIASIFALFTYTNNQKKSATFANIITYLSVSSLSGWVTAATFANISSVLKQLSFYPFGLSETALSIAILIGAAVVTVFVIFKSHGNTTYTLAVLWAIIAIAVANMYRQLNMSVFITCIVLCVLIVSSLVFAKITYGKS